MKRNQILFALTLLLLFLVKSSSFAATACSTGSTLYPNATGSTNHWPAPTYYNTNPISIRTWSGDSNCGILDSDITPITKNKSCAVIVGSGYAGGSLVNYNPSMNNCPIDDYIPLLLLFATLVAIPFVKRVAIVR